MNAYMIYNPEEQGYLFTEQIWGWLPQAEALVFTDLERVEYTVERALTTRGWKLEIHTFELVRKL